MQYDLATAKDCIEWYNNLGEQTCEEVRDYYGITPQEFSTWNPSLGLDCQPWGFQSYCIVTQERLDKTLATKTSSTTMTKATSTTSTPTLGPSPTAWSCLGCYAEDPTFPILEENLNPTGDETLTIPKCQDSCYKDSYVFAGVQRGNECWCGTYVGGEWAKEQASCNTTCTGDKNTSCGGDGFLNIFEAQENAGDEPAPGTSTTDTPIASSSSTALATTSSNAAGGSSSATKRVSSVLQQYMGPIVLLYLLQNYH